MAIPLKLDQANSRICEFETGVDTVDAAYLPAQPVFGTEFNLAQSLPISTTTSTTFQNKVTLALAGLPAGTYRVGTRYGWNHDSAGNDFEARLQLDAVDVGEIHKQEPKDSAGGDPTGTTQRYLAQRTDYLVLSGAHTLTLDYRTDTGGVESSIWDAVIEVWRVQ